MSATASGTCWARKLLARICAGSDAHHGRSLRYTAQDRTMTTPVHPGEALFKGENPFSILPACEHFAGSQKLILKARDLQLGHLPSN